MSLKVGQDRTAMRVILMEVDRANIDKSLQMVADKYISRNGNIAISRPVLERHLRVGAGD